jgi:zinc and cadmium transporter
VLAFSSASLLYIAMADLIPNLHRGALDTNAVRQVALLCLGVATIVLFRHFVG